MDYNFNRMALEIFGKDNRSMPPESPNNYFDQREGGLATYLDLQIVIKWVLPYLLRRHVQKPLVIDVGAGKGRMTRNFAGFAYQCVALEPFAEFYSVLETVCKPYANIETHNCTFSEYVAHSKRMFDLIYVSGVTTYFDDEELSFFFRDASGILAPLGLICVREWSSPKKTEYLPNAINRTREHSIGVAREAGLECIRWRRAYPPFVFDKLHSLWPNRLTEALKITATTQIFYPLWELLAQMNLPRGRRKCYFVYLFRQVTTSTDR